MNNLVGWDKSTERQMTRALTKKNCKSVRTILEKGWLSGSTHSGSNIGFLVQDLTSCKTLKIFMSPALFLTVYR